jgi:predicted RNase H-like HicB family nuclease
MAKRLLRIYKRSVPSAILASRIFFLSKSQLPFYALFMRNEFTAVIERDGDWFVAWSPEIPGANGQGHTLEECRESLSAAIQLILEDRREDGLRGAPANQAP